MSTWWLCASGEKGGLGQGPAAKGFSVAIVAETSRSARKNVFL